MNKTKKILKKGSNQAFGREFDVWYLVAHGSKGGCGRYFGGNLMSELRIHKMPNKTKQL